MKFFDFLMTKNFGPEFDRKSENGQLLKIFAHWYEHAYRLFLRKVKRITILRRKYQ